MRATSTKLPPQIIDSTFDVIKELKNPVVVFDEFLKVILCSDVSEVGLNFVTRRAHVSPVRVGNKRIAISVRRYVAYKTWIVIVAPGTTDAIGFFVDHKVFITVFAQSDGGENTGHAGADDNDADVICSGLRVCHLSISPLFAPAPGQSFLCNQDTVPSASGEVVFYLSISISGRRTFQPLMAETYERRRPIRRHRRLFPVDNRRRMLLQIVCDGFHPDFDRPRRFG